MVATAFHGDQPSAKHIVDHIDTNKKNNRPENLRWITRLENILLNPITLSRIIFKYGSIDDFLANPSKPIDGQLEQNFDWMRTVTKEESENTRQNLINWAKEGKIPKGGQLGEWIYNRNIFLNQNNPAPNYILSKTLNAAQTITFYNDKPNEFPSTPKTIEENPLATYYEKLKEGKIFFRNHNGEYVVVKRGFSKDMQSIYVLTRAAYVYREQENGEYIPVPIDEIQEKVSIIDLPHSLTEVTYYKNQVLNKLKNQVLFRERFSKN
ncbi:HNH endonuclease [Robertkochia sp. 1368]|nr:HNH endonuclease [Robertkochia sediminum]